MALRQIGGSPTKALPGDTLLVVRMYSPLCAACSQRQHLTNGRSSSSPGNHSTTTSSFDDLEMLTLFSIDDFEARSPDELSLSKGDRIKLIERDDDFGDGWYLGEHIQNGKTGLFPEGMKVLESLKKSISLTTWRGSLYHHHSSDCQYLCNIDGNSC